MKRVSITEKKPVFSWLPILFHYIFALGISWFGASLMQSSPSSGEMAQRFLFEMSTLISSIGGYAAISPYPNHVRLYLLICWMGVPMYFLFFWRLSAHILTKWVESQNSLRFWLVMLGNFVAVFAIWWLPSEAYAIRAMSLDYSKSSKILSLTKDSFIFFSILGFASVYAFSFSVGVCTQAIRIRLFK